MFEKMKYFEKKRDDLRRLLLNEPRGRSAMCHNIVLPPCNPKADAGFLVMEHEEYPAMSGPNTIATTTILLETGMVPMQELLSELALDTPVGFVTVYAECEKGKCQHVEFHNVPAFVYVLDKEIEVPGLGTTKVYIAWGGMFYCLVDAGSVGLIIRPEAGAEIVRIGERIKRAVQEQTNPVQAENPEIRGVTILEFTTPLEVKDVKKTQNAVIVYPGRIDRSPCGTGAYARLAVSHARGELKEGELLYYRSIINTEFIDRGTGMTKWESTTLFVLLLRAVHVLRAAILPFCTQLTRFQKASVREIAGSWTSRMHHVQIMNIHLLLISTLPLM
ncbi:hypothetical protein QQS21_000248 [Conoideocrella luteorostrata]|uniref:Proline racemase n=1 Tax=Conoideocrella luteorostrata TaxID=1105319 RepID=A0AAJ0D050_9HYPO|nr:hypothetical protein QQS21_000248 [Conoideocrella luteorostrata]